MEVTVKEDLVMQRVIREQGALLVERVDDLETLRTAWIVLHGGGVAVPDDAALRPALQAAFMTAQPYRLAYEGWRTLQEYLEPPKPPNPELQAIAKRLDSFFGVRPRPKIQG